MSPSRKPDDLYFVNPLVDAFFVGGASLLLFAYFRLTLTGYARAQVAGSTTAAVALLAWIGNWPHFSATAYRLYQSREHVRQFPLTAWLIPALAALATTACFWYPASFAPYFIKLFVLWSPYHFSAQTLGITLLYARRANLPVSRRARIALGIFFVAGFLTQYAQTEMALSTGFLYAAAYPQFPLPTWAPLAFRSMTYASLLWAALELLPEMRRLPRFPWILLLPIVTHYVWFVYGSDDISFQLFIPFFHALQYLLLAWAIEMGSARRPLARTLLWFSLNAAFGAFLFLGIPHLLSLRGWNFEYALLILAAGISLHHYFVDGVIWKLRREPEESPLFRNVAWAWRKERA